MVKDDYIALCVDMSQCIEPAFYDDEDDPFVGLYVPPEWKHLQSFSSNLREFRIPGFEHISDHDELDSTDNYPLWSTVHLAPLFKLKQLDVEVLEKEMVDRVRKLVAKEEKITGIISKLRQKAV